MKCYSCGGIEKHIFGCPKYRFEMPARKTIKKEDIIEDFKEDYFYKPNAFVSEKPQPKRIWKSFLPLELQGGTVISAGSIALLSGSPYCCCRPYRLWIDESIAQGFMILGLFLGVEGQLIGTGKVPANLFRTGRWPITNKPEKDSEGRTILTPSDWKALEVGIDLSTWKTIEIGQRVSMQVENISAMALRCEAVLEVICI